MLRSKSVIISAILHTLVLVALTLHFKALPTPKKKLETIPVVMTGSPKAPRHKAIKHRRIVAAEPKGIKPCEHWYGGIGVYTEAFSEGGRLVIKAVMPGYAAESIGLLPGDIIEESSSSPLLGNPGETLYLIIYRNDNRLVFETKRSKVCID